jgi:hypothetical protein
MVALGNRDFRDQVFKPTNTIVTEEVSFESELKRR